MDELLSFHVPLLKEYLSSDFKRNYDKVVTKVLESLNLGDKIGVRLIVFIDDTFKLSAGTLGNSSGDIIFIVHKNDHFFLAKRVPTSVEDSVLYNAVSYTHLTLPTIYSV